MGFEDFLKYLSTDMGVSAAVNAVLLVITAYAIEFWPRWNKLSSPKKRLAFMVPLSFVVPMLATVVGVLYYNWSTAFDVTWWPALVAGFTAAFAGTLAHTPKLNK
jgi:hypothetical protein